MERMYIIDPDNFKGQIITSISRESFEGLDVDTLTTDYSHKTFKDMNADGKLLLLTLDEFWTGYYEPHLKGMQGPFKETTEEAYWDALEALPPKRFTSRGNNRFFFLGECYTADLYSCYVKIGEKYYSALRSIHTPEADILSLKDVA